MSTGAAQSSGQQCSAASAGLPGSTAPTTVSICLCCAQSGAVERPLVCRKHCSQRLTPPPPAVAQPLASGSGDGMYACLFAWSPVLQGSGPPRDSSRGWAAESPAVRVPSRGARAGPAKPRPTAPVRANSAPVVLVAFPRGAPPRPAPPSTSLARFLLLFLLPAPSPARPGAPQRNRSEASGCHPGARSFGADRPCSSPGAGRAVRSAPPRLS
mmetsp:Transcript_127465/g.342097  ORF Transcript_127465/g.342097 Transcript_127465/m.342097 type:complete len:213 (+) Transcript_127465:62-700(+)